VTHPHLSSLPSAEQRQEIEASARHLADVLGRPIAEFCYPFGDFSPETVRLVRELGFETACTVRPASVTRRTRPLELPRVAVENWDAEALERVLESRLT
jgi:peptidoglycan/xylan/chitin deacetylase (PgdA/CDA1 family)